MKILIKVIACTIGLVIIKLGSLDGFPQQIEFIANIIGLAIIMGGVDLSNYLDEKN